MASIMNRVRAVVNSSRITFMNTPECLHVERCDRELKTKREELAEIESLISELPKTRVLDRGSLEIRASEVRDYIAAVERGKQLLLSIPAKSRDDLFVYTDLTVDEVFGE